MICKRCGAEIPDDSLRCRVCGVKVNMYCPQCNTLNKFGNKTCDNCGFELLVKCETCNTENIYFADKCRKCGADLNPVISANKIREAETLQQDTVSKTPDINLFKLFEESETVKDIMEEKKKSEPALITADKDGSEASEETEELPESDEEAAQSEHAEVEEEHNADSEYNVSETAENEEEIEAVTDETEQQTESTDIEDTVTADTEDFEEFEPEDNAEEADSEDEIAQHADAQTDETDSETEDFEEFEPEDNAEEADSEDEIAQHADAQTDETDSETEDFEECSSEEETGENLENPEDIEEFDATDEESQANEEAEETLEPETPEMNEEPENNGEDTSETVEDTAAEETETEEPDETAHPEESQDDILAEFDESEEKSAGKYEDYPDAVLNTVQNVLSLVKNSIEKHIIGLCGSEQNGKSVILKQISKSLNDENYVVLYGSCTPLLQITGFGFFQKAFLRLFGLPSYTANRESLKDSFFEGNIGKSLSFLSDIESDVFFNMLYPAEYDAFENIKDNKKIAFAVIEKVIKAISKHNNLIIAIDDFELLDGASYDFILNLRGKGYFNNRLKLIGTYRTDKPFSEFFNTEENDKDNIFETIKLSEYTKEDIIKSVSTAVGFPLSEVFPEDFVNDLITASDENTMIMEQQTALLFNSGYISIKGEDVSIHPELKPEDKKYTFEELVKLRINTLLPSVKNVLFLAAITGMEFPAKIVAKASDTELDKTAEIFDILSQEMFIEEVDGYSYEFTSLDLWKTVYNEAKKDILYKENSQKIYEVCKNYILSSCLQKLISCSEALNKEEEWNIWNETAQLSAKTGDTNLYIIAKKQMLKLLDEVKFDNENELKLRIYEELGKLLYKKSPDEAILYLANVLNETVNKSDVNKTIDVSGYFITSCYLTGNYNGVIETTDSILTMAKMPDTNLSHLDIALITTRKLKALLCKGNCEQVIMTVGSEILPSLEGADERISEDEVFGKIYNDAIINSKIILALAYALQGSKMSLKAVEDAKKAILARGIKSDYHIAKASITEAFALTVRGYIPKSKEILDEIAEVYKDKPLKTDLLAFRSIINILNRVFSDNMKNIKDDLFELASFTNNINEPFMKNIVKLILGYVISKDGNNEKALEIYNEEIAYFANEKIATGALASWLLIVRAATEMHEYDKALTTATKSLEIAESAKINNLFFATCFKKELAELYLQKGDIKAAKMYLEEAIKTAKENNLKYMLACLYVTFAKCLETLMNATNVYPENSIKLTLEMYDKAVETAQELEGAKLIMFTSRELAAFKTFCHVKSIEI